jgi:hypothetical protein
MWDQRGTKRGNKRGRIGRNTVPIIDVDPKLLLQLYTYVRSHTPGVDSSLALDGSPTGRRLGANLIGLCLDRGCERVGGTSLHRYTPDVCSS